ncbi:MAG TPA: glycosyltransferase [Actinophytocola sp.]|uniref:glycosyltransferase n=1 Tax=Actinophytocola sp. TaxID=1872138 RepID=UPI002DB79FB5|nr:glycosyltransferase [Actinophytocola sp.]HEU5474140.1 glycosyltransferase [Actinophytocola sp.]
MKIVQLANFYSPISGGLRTVVDTLGRGYVSRGHQRVLVVPGARPGRWDTAAGLVVTLPGVAVSGGYRMIARPSAVLRVLDEIGPDSVEVSDKATLVGAAGWARTRGVRAVLLSHERLDRWVAARLPGLWRRAGPVLDRAVRRWNRSLASRFDTVVVTTAYAEAEFAPLDVPNVRRIPLGVDLSTFRPAPVATGRTARLVYAGRLSPEKNAGAVIEAVRLLAAAGEPVRLDVYGDGAARAALTRQAGGLPVCFHGHLADRPALARALAAADLAFAPSAAETFGLSVLEALACGTPVITAAGGGAAELLGPGTGLAVPPHPAGLAAGVLEVLSWPPAQRRRTARLRAEQFPWAATISAMLDLHTADRRG